MTIKNLQKGCAENERGEVVSGMAPEHSSGHFVEYYRRGSLKMSDQWTELKICDMLASELVGCGVPKSAIITNVKVRATQHQVIHADLIIAAENQKTPVAIFEVKKSERYYDRASRIFADVRNNFPCYYVCPETGGLKVLGVGQNPSGEWISVSAKDDAFRQLIGEYTVESAMAINRQEDASNEIVQKDVQDFRRGICEISIALVATLGFLEICQIRLSLNLYILIGLLLALYSVSFGVIIKFEARGVKIGVFWRDRFQKGGL